MKISSTTFSKGEEQILMTSSDLKEIIISSMIKQFEILNEAPLKEWQINDVRQWHFEEWLKALCTEKK